MRISPLLPLAAALAFATAAEAAPPNIQVSSVKPDVNDTLVYLPLPAPEFAGEKANQLSIDLYLKNLDVFQADISSVKVEFPLQGIPTVNLSAGLQVRCPGISDEPLEIPALPSNFDCRVSLLPDMKLPDPGPNLVKIKLYIDGNPTPLTIYKNAAPHTNPTPTGSYRFPARQSDLPAGTYWAGQSSGAGSHHRAGENADMIYAYDMGVVRFDEGSGTWKDTEAPSPGERTDQNQNSDFLVFGVPIYAMADGLVVGCEDGNEDNEYGSDEPYGDPNFVEIQHGDEIAWYGHLQDGSIDPAVCADGAFVSEGQFLGRAGNSGDSAQPHLHIQVKRQGSGLPLRFTDIFTMTRTSWENDTYKLWSGVSGAGLLWEKNILWIGGLRREFDAAGSAVTELAISNVDSLRKVTVARNSQGNLQTDLWTQTSGYVSLSDTDTGGGLSAGYGAVAGVTPNGTEDFAAVVRTSAGNLKVISYNVYGYELVRQHERTDGPVQAVAAAPAPFPGGFVTAVRTQFGNLKVIAYVADVSSSLLDRRGEAAGSGAIKRLAVAKTQAFQGVVAAVRASNDQLRLESFGIGWAGTSVNLDDTLQISTQISDVSIAWVGLTPEGHDIVMTAAQRLDGTLHVAAFSIGSLGGITLLGSTTGGPASDISIARGSDNTGVAAMSDASGNLKLIAFHLREDHTFVRRAEADGGQASKVRIADAMTEDDSGADFAVAAMRDGSGNLRLIDWQVLLND